MNEKEKIINEYVDELLDIIYHHDDITTSDLQGILYALVARILERNL